MAALQYYEKHNQVALLSKPKESAGYHQMIDFLNSSYIRFALTESPIIYDSLIKQFWQTATAITLDDASQEIHAMIDTRLVIVSEGLVRMKLQLNDANGIDMLPNEEIFQGLQNIGYPTDGSFNFWKPKFSPQWKLLIHYLLHCMSRRSGGWDQFGSNLATALICLSTGRVFNFSKMIFSEMIGNLSKKNKFLMYPRFLQIILGIETKDKTPYDCFKIQKKIFANLKRGFSGDPKPLLPAMLVRTNNAGTSTQQQNQASTAAETEEQKELEKKVEGMAKNLEDLMTEFLHTREVLGNVVIKSHHRLKKHRKVLKAIGVEISDSEEKEERRKHEEEAKQQAANEEASEEHQATHDSGMSSANKKILVPKHSSMIPDTEQMEEMEAPEAEEERREMIKKVKVEKIFGPSITKSDVKYRTTRARGTMAVPMNPVKTAGKRKKSIPKKKSNRKKGKVDDVIDIDREEEIETEVEKEREQVEQVEQLDVQVEQQVEVEQEKNEELEKKEKEERERKRKGKEKVNEDKSPTKRVTRRQALEEKLSLATVERLIEEDRAASEQLSLEEVNRALREAQGLLEPYQEAQMEVTEQTETEQPEIEQEKVDEQMDIEDNVSVPEEEQSASEVAPPELKWGVQRRMIFVTKWTKSKAKRL